MPAQRITSRRSSGGTFGPHWSAKEDEILRSLVGVVPYRELFKTVRQQLGIQGLPLRSPQAIRTRISRLGLCTRQHDGEGEWMLVTTAAQILGIRRTTLQSWMRYFPDFPYKRLGKLRYVSRKQFKAWAGRHVHLLRDIERGNLIMFFEDEAFADQVIESTVQRIRPVGRRPVRCTTTGITYPSVTAAAAAIHVTPSAVTRAIRVNKPVVGYRFEPAKLR